MRLEEIAASRITNFGIRVWKGVISSAILTQSQWQIVSQHPNKVAIERNAARFPTQETLNLLQQFLIIAGYSIRQCAFFVYDLWLREFQHISAYIDTPNPS